MDLTSITQLLLQQIGLDHSTIGVKSIELGVQMRMQSLKLSDLAEYAERLRDSRAELQSLIEEVVVPETWFFRGLEQLRYMAHVGTQWKPALSGQPLRVLSVPCSTGEEPYSIGMFLRHAGLAPEQLRIVAADISQRAIDRATKASYSDMSFRETEPLCDVLRHRFFERHSTNVVAAEVRRVVSFQRENLVSPTFLADGSRFDFIFCRNVLIYFDQPARQQVLKTLDRLLAPNGYIFGGHAEPLALFDSRFRSVGPPGAFAYQRSEAASTASGKKPLFSPPPSAKPVIRPAQPAFRSSFAVSESTAPAPPRSDGVSGLDAAEEAANSGQLADARTLCEQHLERNGPTAAALCLMGVIQQAAGEVADAEKSFQKAVYLDPAHKDSLWHLTLLAEQRGDQRAVETFKRRLARATSAGDQR